MAIDAAVILNAITAALLVGAGKLLLDVKMAVAVLEEKARAHHDRISDLEDRPACPHIHAQH